MLPEILTKMNKAWTAQWLNLLDQPLTPTRDQTATTDIITPLLSELIAYETLLPRESGD